MSGSVSPKHRDNGCFRCLTQFYHGNGYLIYCILQIIICVGLLITLIYDQCTEKVLKFGPILYIEATVLTCYTLDIIMRVILLPEFFKTWYYIVDFCVFWLVFACYVVVLVNHHLVGSEDIDLAVLIGRFVFMTIYIALVISRSIKDKKTQKDSIITLDLNVIPHSQDGVEMNDLEDNKYQSESVRTMSCDTSINVTLGDIKPV